MLVTCRTAWPARLHKAVSKIAHSHCLGFTVQGKTPRGRDFVNVFTVVVNSFPDPYACDRLSGLPQIKTLKSTQR